ncbi:MAG: acyltransferase [Phycisphaerales bacterium JB065]
MDQIALGDRVHIWPMARLEALSAGAKDPVIEIGSGTSIQPFVHLGAVLSIRIGRDCLFASHVYITDHDHDWRDGRTPARLQPNVIAAPVVIGDGVWLGERVCVLKGVTIGDGAIVGAGSVVTKDIPARCIAVGSPARVVKRWNDETQEWESVR